jgi:DNA-binding MarR family transcriptional regulator
VNTTTSHIRAAALDICLAVSHAHASLNLKLDAELGALHGLSLADFHLLRLLAQADGGQLPLAALARPLGMQQSMIVRQVLALEKTGKVRREKRDASTGGSAIAITPGSRRVVAEAEETVAALCTAALWDLSSQELAQADTVLSHLCGSQALAL